ncbi:hypothetical protein NMY22_g5754 [Coprinellus aureogranulatus]|nr:hypothetical protein NMY22_g5754 [Coprinellus aureogranulatus]
MFVSQATLRKLRELGCRGFQSVLDYAASRCRSIAETYSHAAGKLGPAKIRIFLGDFECEITTAAYLVGLGYLYHSTNVKPPKILQKLANLQSLGQLRNITAVAELVASERQSRSNNVFVVDYECEWWTQYFDGTLSTVEEGPALTPELLYECWEKQRDSFLPSHPSEQEPYVDFLDLLPLSRDELNSACRTTEQLIQETAMESITTLEYLRQVDKSVRFSELLRTAQPPLVQEDPAAMAIRNLLKVEWVALGCYIYWRRRWFLEYVGNEAFQSGFNRRLVELYTADVESTMVLQGYQVLSGVLRPFAGQAWAARNLGKGERELWNALRSGELLEDIPYAMLPFRFTVKHWWIEGMRTPTADSIFQDFLEAWYHLLNNVVPPESQESQEALQAVLEDMVTFLDEEANRFSNMVQHYEDTATRLRSWLDETQVD